MREEPVVLIRSQVKMWRHRIQYGAGPLHDINWTRKPTDSIEPDTSPGELRPAPTRSELDYG